MAKLLKGDNPPADDMSSEIYWMHLQEKVLTNAYIFSACVLLAGVVLFIAIYQGCQHTPALTREYTDEQFVQAIAKAEGRPDTFGIRSIPCYSQVQCHMVALRTVEASRKRYDLYGYRRYPDFIKFLQSRWCPSSEDSCKTWYKNVTYFLKKGDL